MKRIAAICLGLSLGVIAAHAQHGYKPKEGYVPNAETAIAIAVAVWKPICGKENIEKQKPYRASLSKGIWTVVGSLPNEMLGGTAEATFQRMTEGFFAYFTGNERRTSNNTVTLVTAEPLA